MPAGNLMGDGHAILGLGEVVLERASGDASFRRYWRLCHGETKTRAASCVLPAPGATWA